MTALKIKLSVFFFFILSFLVAANSAIAGKLGDNLANQDRAFLATSKFNAGATIGSTIALIINAVLGLLGIIFVILIIYSGFQWMTAEGNEEKVTKAKETITRAIIGLIIIVAAYAITYFIFNAINGSTGGGGGGGIQLL